jgi:hypothetical protein
LRLIQRREFRKAKPLKQPKKAEKDLSAEDIAFQQKQKVSKHNIALRLRKCSQRPF